MKVSLINGSFKHNGQGVSTYSQCLYEGLIKFGINVEKIEIGANENNKFKIPGSRTINKSKFLLLHGRELYYKNLHLMTVEVLPISLIKHVKKKIVTVHDLFVFDDQLMKVNLNQYKNIAKYFQLHLLKRRREEYHHIKDYDFVLTINEGVKNQLISDFGVNPNKVAIIYNIIPDKFRPLEKQNDKENKNIIGYINNPNINKILKLKKFIEIFKGIKDDRLEFEIYGKSFPFTELIKDDPRIKYLGFLPEEKIIETYNSFDVYLSTSIMEGFGLPIMQAKACKVPVLCYDGDIPDIVKRNTLIWNDDNLEEIIKNRSWEKVDVEKAYLDAEECRADKIIPKMINVYKNVFGDN